MIFMKKGILHVSAIRSALENLHSVIGHLEHSVETMEMTRKGEQRDMFASSPSNENGQNSGVSGEVIAKRLDSAIEKVEKLLGEENAA